MVQKKIDFSKDVEKYKEVGELIEQRLLFLTADYHFSIEKRLEIYAVFIFYRRRDLSVMISYGAPEFEVDMGIQFNKGSEYYGLGKLLGISLFHWDWEWVPKMVPYDKVMSGVNTVEVFLKKELDFIIQHQKLFIQALEKN